MSSRRRYRFGPLEQRSVVGPLRAGQVAIVAVAALFGLGALDVVRSLFGLVSRPGGARRRRGGDPRAAGGAHRRGVGAGGAALGAAGTPGEGRLSLGRSNGGGAEQRRR